MATPTKTFLKFWGVRGSIPTPGRKTVRYGGNTACVELKFGKTHLVFDAGTGLRLLGQQLIQHRQVKLTILLSHYHSDHLMGLPFFDPIFKATTELNIYGATTPLGGPCEAVKRQFSPPSFPVDFSSLHAQIKFHSVKAKDKFSIGSIEIEAAHLNHPNQAIAYRARAGKRDVVYASDHEHDGYGDQSLIEFCANADILIYDAMYSNKTYKKGWGHSTWQEAIRVAKNAKVKRLFLFHHDPENDDKALAQIQQAAKKQFAGARVAKEGELIELKIMKNKSKKREGEKTGR